MLTIQMPLQLFSSSEHQNNKISSSSSHQHHQARRISLPNALNSNQLKSNNNLNKFKSQRSRTPNSLSPKLGFLKEISEFDIDPPFISPGASSSSSADNSNCNSPMLLSPFTHRPASARPYRRNKINNNNNKNQQLKIQEDNNINLNNKRNNINIQSMRASRRSEPFIFGNCVNLEDDDFKWTDVDGFYGRKNSIPLQQLLATDLALLKGIQTKNEQINGIISDVENNEIVNKNNLKEENNEINEEIDNLKIGKFKKNQRKSFDEVRKSSSTPMSSPTKRRLKLIKNKLYSLEDENKGSKVVENEKNDIENQNQLNSDEKVKLMDSLDELNDNEKDEDNDDDIHLLRKVLKSKKQQIQQYRHFSVDQDGQRIIDSGIVKTIKSKIHSNRQTQKRNPKARRATCPEIWLSEAEDEERLIMRCAVRLFGCNSVGKKSIAKQLASAAEISPPDEGIVSTDCEDVQRPYRTVSFLLNEHEINMQIIQGSLLPQNQQKSEIFEEFTIFAVVYSVDNRESFIRAAQILYRLYGERKIAKREQKILNKKKIMEYSFLPLILVANKSDLQRKRKISSIEGKMLAKIYKCPFVEMSALLSANVDNLWHELIRKLYKYEKIVDHFVVEKQENQQKELVGRIVERTRRFAKSCEDWITTKIVPK